AFQAGFDRMRNDGIAAGDATAVLATGLIARASGGEPPDASAWTKALANPPAEISYVYRMVSVRELLTGTELETLGRAAFGDAKSLHRPSQDDIREFDQRIDAVRATPTVLVRTISGYPRGFVADVFAVERCDLARAQKIGGGEAMVTLRPDGRVL